MHIPENIADVKTLRKKQLIVFNLIQLPVTLTVFFLAYFFNLTIGDLLIAVVFFGIIRGLLLLRQSKTTRRLVPVFEQAAVYEQAVLGDEYRKNKILESVIMFMVSAVMLMQFATLDIVDSPFLPDLPIALGMLLLFILLINVSEVFHFSKIDSPEEEGDHINFTRRRLYSSLKIALVTLVVIVGAVTLVFFTVL